MVLFVVVEQMDVDCLRADNLKSTVMSKFEVLQDVIVHQSIDSTNSWCLQQSKSGRKVPFACFAEEQTSGRGRRGKRWLMSAHSNVAMSLAWPFALPVRLLHLLPLSVALAVVETLEGLGIRYVQIKWPNDVYVRGKKIAGILIETQSVAGKYASIGVAAGKTVVVVIGLGLNYRMRDFELTNGGKPLMFTDVCEQFALQKIAIKPERNIVASALLCNVVSVCQNFIRASEENLKKFRSSYDFCRQKKVDVILGDGEVLSGVAQGVNDDAELLVMINGELRAFNSAEVSVQPGEVVDMS